MEHHFGAVDETTKRLVGRCVCVPWLKKDDDDNHNHPEPGGDDEANEASVAARKLLDVEIPGGMASSLSVVEVTTQRERPGVLTGSRQREEDHDKRDGSAATRPQRSDDDDDGPPGQRLEAAGFPPTLQETSPFEVEGEA